MRIIKFRVWNKDKNCFFTDDHVKEHLLGYLSTAEYPIMQFTGLTDKNGKEIYEGDVVKNRSGVNYLIEWENDGMRFCIKPGIWGITKKAVMREGYEIIGNIYENPELLK